MEPNDIVDSSPKSSPDAAVVPVSAPDAAEKRSRSPWVALVIFAILATIIAWIAMVYSEYVSFGSAVVGLLASVAGAILVGKGAWRSIAITSAIAAGVLTLVFVLLWAALSIITN
ncbi:MAG: hypothetical protein NC102_10505 [Clostridium sp.]|nr:hypothetical protein [Clostridium sp.]